MFRELRKKAILWSTGDELDENETMFGVYKECTYYRIGYGKRLFYGSKDLNNSKQVKFNDIKEFQNGYNKTDYTLLDLIKNPCEVYISTESHLQYRYNNVTDQLETKLENSWMNSLNTLHHFKDDKFIKAKPEAIEKEVDYSYIVQNNIWTCRVEHEAIQDLIKIKRLDWLKQPSNFSMIMSILNENFNTEGLFEILNNGKWFVEVDN